MNKEVIYIDIEDDITGIIGKVKDSKEKIVALVPPKRIGVLQSAVNLKLLRRAADHSDKRVVLITSDHSLVLLAAGLDMPVAKNLQSKPEVPQLNQPELDAEEVINGQELPVGDIAASRGQKASLPPTESQKEAMAIGDAAIEATAPNVKPMALAARDKAKTDAAKKARIPNFERFRKRFFLIGGGAIALAVFLFWALTIAPHASVVISAKTTTVNIDKILTLDPAATQSDIAAGKLKLIVKQLKKDASVAFTPTGSKTIGTSATGTVTVRNCDYPGGFTLPSGTKFTSADGHDFVSTQAVTVPTFTGPSSGCTLAGSSSGKASVAVSAANIGAPFNIDAQAYSIQSFTGKVDALGTAMTGGSSQVVTVVSQDDINKAQAQLTKPDDTAAQKELAAQFGADSIVINESFSPNAAAAVSSPGLGEQSPQAKLSQETTYTLAAVSRADTKLVLHSQVDPVLKQANQLYDLGDGHIIFQSFTQLQGGTYTSRMTSQAAIGPKINIEALAEQIKGKRSGEVEQIISQIPGVQSVKVQYSPFWVTGAPDPSKTDIKFSISNGS